MGALTCELRSVTLADDQSGYEVGFLALVLIHE